ncbi:MAG: magnesium-protoporphyrin IX monomethyl ester cyclase, partial [Mesorhizobium sp.]
YTKMGRRVWFREVWGFLVTDNRVKGGPTLAEFWGAPQDAEEESMTFQRPAKRPVMAPAAEQHAFGVSPPPA